MQQAIRLLAAALLAPAAVSAQEEDAPILPPVTDERPLEVAEEAEIPAEGDPVSLYAGFSVVTEYVSRGLVFSDKPSFQPWFEAYFSLPTPQDAGVLTDWSLFAGTWNSFQNGDPGFGQPRDDQLPNWYETDVYVGLAATFSERVSTSFAYYYYDSPADSFASYHELEWKLNYDDGGLWEGVVPLNGFAIKPGIRITQEVNRPNTPDGLYIQPSLTPTFVIGDFGPPITVAVPLVWGLADDYYTDNRGEDETYGYFKTGLLFSVPLELLPESAGEVMLTGGVDYWLPNDEIASGLGEDEVVGRIGLNWAF